MRCTVRENRGLGVRLGTFIRDNSGVEYLLLCRVTVINFGLEPVVLHRLDLKLGVRDQLGHL